MAELGLGVLSLGITVTQELYKYYNTCKDQTSDVTRATSKLGHLLEWLKRAQSTVDGRQSRNGDDPQLAADIASRIDDCHELVAELEGELDKFKPKLQRQGTRDSIVAVSRKATYPFRKSTLVKLGENVDEFVHLLEQTLDLLEHQDVGQIRDDIEDITVLLNQVSADHLSVQIRDWLKAPDATINFNEVVKNKNENTGSWFVLGPQFTSWLDEPNSFLWLVGFAGCGKSALCSTAIEHTLRRRKANAKIGIAFFYFTFNDETKRDASAMLRALILQLSGQLGSKHPGHKHLAELHNRYRNATPPVSDLLKYLRKLVKEFSNAYILLDALDESPAPKHRDEVLECVTELREWSENGLHILVTSRDEVDIRQDLEATPEETIKVQNEAHNKDIRRVISERLQYSKKLKRWKAHHDQIEEALSSRCNGVFRWVECQLQGLQGCPPSENLLKRHLQSLPATLEETYERILANISSLFRDYAQRVLMLLCCAARPLTLEELIGGIAIELGDTPRYDPERRLEDIDSIQQLCPGLTEVDIAHSSQKPYIRIAHFSVREYLESEAIGKSKEAAFFSVRPQTAHVQMACISLTALLSPSLPPTILSGDEIVQKGGIVSYAGSAWPFHYRAADFDPQIEAQLRQLFIDQGWLFERWCHIIEARSLNCQFEPPVDGIYPSPLVLASALGLTSIVPELLKVRGADTDTEVNFGQALKGAAENNQEHIVRILLDSGVSATEKDNVRALELASKWGYAGIVQLLVDDGVNVSLADGKALHEASKKGYEDVAKILLENGADVNARDYRKRPALKLASGRGYQRIVEMLVAHGADVSADCDIALQEASFGGHMEVVKFLIKNGADIHAESEGPLSNASRGGHKELVQYFIDRGADIHAKNDHALLMASTKDVAQLLLDNGADVVAHHQAAFSSASQTNNEELIQVLIDYGADVNAQGPQPAALQLASVCLRPKAVRVLLANGADINLQGGPFGSALQAASTQGHVEIVRILLENKADVNIKEGEYGPALQAASARGHEEVVRLLLEHNADVNAEGGPFGSALKAAESRHHKKIIDLLMKASSKISSSTAHSEISALPPVAVGVDVSP